jgi:predicted branched-subunit amino acid permease
MAMSALVFAGSAQFIAVGLLTAGIGWPMIVLTTFVVNLRTLSTRPPWPRMSAKWRNGGKSPLPSG